ncbi:MAG: general secretion pathway protein GspK [Rhodospirillales bacterium]|nr:general secretion pathway protein GspK [Rhodospirillales bacterium]
MTRPAIRARRRREGGVALLIVLWVLGLLAALAVILAADARTAVQTSEVTIALARAQAAADAGVWLTVRDVAGGAPGAAGPVDGTPRRIAFAGFALDVSVQDEGGKVDLNFAGPWMLRAALTAAGAPGPEIDGLVREIVAWRTPLSAGAAAYGGGAAGPYPGRSYGPAHAPFAGVDDLRLLPGITPALFDRLRRLVTVYSQDPLIDPRSAPLILLDALPGIDPQAAAAYVARRDRLGGGDALLSALGAPDDLSTQGSPVAYTIRVDAVGGGVRFVREAVIVLTPDGVRPYRVARWQQGAEDDGGGA